MIIIDFLLILFAWFGNLPLWLSILTTVLCAIGLGFRIYDML